MEKMYKRLFNRNIGNITESEQARLSQAVVAIAGCGGVGSTVMINLARIGVGTFVLADPEEYAETDVNRQVGASGETFGKKKVTVQAALIKAINPEARVTVFEDGLTVDNIHDFLSDASIVVDALEFFCIDERHHLFEEARKKRIHILSSPIFGFGCAVAVFDPAGPTFEETFGPRPREIDIKYVAHFGRTFFPKFPRYVDLEAYAAAMKKGRPIPSFSTSANLSGAATAAEIMFILLEKRKPVCMPFVKHFDLYTAKIRILDSRKKYIVWWQKILLWLICRKKNQLGLYREMIQLFSK